MFEYPAGKGAIVHQVYTMADRLGGLHAFTVRYYSVPKKADRSRGHSELLHNVSRDGGLTWTAPRRFRARLHGRDQLEKPECPGG